MVFGREWEAYKPSASLEILLASLLIPKNR